ncbi:MAG: metalloregulator ArsR/SmtB family transcription factor, partial [Clostridia bacterium]|nr:metalloregulator ArsR/SmtB family transcription factor [Clostridia bacterium]
MAEDTKQRVDSAQEIRNMLPNDDVIYSLAELFKMFGDPTRAKILECLQIRDLYVGEIAEILEMSISAVSHQLRVLRSAKLVKGTKEGKEVK